MTREASPAEVAVLDYGVGNLGSILNMLRHIEVPATVVRDSASVRRAGRLILPGVGAFDRGMAGLARDDLGEAVLGRAADGVPLLGVCLGMQLLAEGSAEGAAAGLGLVPGRCERLRPATAAQRVPHMGWDWITPRRDHPLLALVPVPSKFYFTHSYHLICRDESDVIATSEYGGGVTAVVGRDNVVGAQFHPEKSHTFGMSLLRSFAEWSP